MAITQKRFLLLVLIAGLCLSVSAVAQNSDNFLSRSTFTGDWGGARSKLAEQYGVSFSGFWQNDFFAVTGKGDNPNANTGAGNWSRIRGTMDIDMNKLAHVKGMSFHITSTLNEGLDVGSDSRYLGDGINGAVGNNTINHQLRLDSFWIKQDLFNNKLSLYAGQISGFDFFGFLPQDFSHFATLGPFYGPLALYNSFSSADPMTTPAVMLQITPNKHFYYRTMVQSITEGPDGFYSWGGNDSGTDMKIKDGAVWHNEVAFLYGQGDGKAKSLPGEFHFGVSYSGAKAFTNFKTGVAGFQPNSDAGYENFYWAAKQAVWRPEAGSNRGLDLGATIVWGPEDKGVLPFNRQVVATAEFNGLIPRRPKDSINFAFDYFGIRGPLKSANFKSEKVYELNYAVQVTPWLQLMPDLQIHQDVSANPAFGTGTVFGLRSFVNF